MLLVVFATERRPVAFGFAAGLAVLTRLDLAIFVLVIGATLGRVRLGPFGALGAGGILCYVMYSLLTVPPYHWS